jgi:hypothetical protein
MFYTAAFIQPNELQAPSFSMRGIKQFTQSTLTDVSIYGKSHISRSAYDGYRANLEAFLYATCHGTKTSVTYFGFPLSNVTTVPFPLRRPVIAFNLKATATEQGIAKMMEKWSQMGIQKITQSKK